MKNKIKFSALLIFQFSFILLHAQKSYELKLYNSMQYRYLFRSYPSYSYEQITKTTQLLKLMAGFSIQKEKSSFDIFISSLSHQNAYVKSKYTDTFGQPDWEYRVTSLSLGCQFIKSWILISTANKRLQYFLGAGLEPIFVQNRTLPDNGGSFKTRSTGYTANAYLIPRLKYKLNEKISIELTLPVNLLNYSHQRQWVGNPLFAPKQQITKITDWNALPKQVILNVGIACKI